MKVKYFSFARLHQKCVSVRFGVASISKPFYRTAVADLNLLWGVVAHKIILSSPGTEGTLFSHFPGPGPVPVV